MPELNAKFGVTEDDNTNGLMGTIDGFRLNDGTDDPGWSVELKRARWSTDRYQLTTTGDATTDDDHIIAGTAVEWSIDRVASPGQTGQWEAQLFDESPNDNSTSPTTVLGRFEAGFGGNLTKWSARSGRRSNSVHLGLTDSEPPVVSCRRPGFFSVPPTTLSVRTAGLLITTETEVVSCVPFFSSSSSGCL